MATKVGEKTEFDFIVVGGSSTIISFECLIFCINAAILNDLH